MSPDTGFVMPCGKGVKSTTVLWLYRDGTHGLQLILCRLPANHDGPCQGKETP